MNGYDEEESPHMPERQFPPTVERLTSHIQSFQYSAQHQEEGSFTQVMKIYYEMVGLEIKASRENV